MCSKGTNRSRQLELHQTSIVLYTTGITAQVSRQKYECHPALQCYNALCKEKKDVCYQPLSVNDVVYMLRYTSVTFLFDVPQDNLIYRVDQ